MDKSKKIIHVVDKLSIGGAEKTLVILANIFSQKGHNVSVLTFYPDGGLDDQLEKNIQIKCINRTNKYSIFKMYETYQILKNYDIIHIHMRHVFKYIYLCKILFNLKTKLYFHDQYGRIDLENGMDNFLKSAIKNSYYISVRQVLIDWVTNHIPQKKEVYLLKNVVPRINSNNNSNNDSNLLHLAIISNFRKVKNIEFGLEIINLLKTKIKCKLTIYGQLVDKEYFDFIKIKISELGLENEVEIEHNVSEIQEVLYKHQIVLHPSFSEAYPISLIECLAQNTPFIAYNPGELNEILSENLPFSLLKELNTEKWVNRILEINSDLSNFRNRTEIFYEKEYSIEKYYEKCLKIYEVNY